MNLPDFPKVSDDLLGDIASRHGASAVSPISSVGIFNAVYLLGDDLILRIPRDHPNFIAAAYREATAVPVARAAGVRTPDLVTFDDSRDLLPVPYLVYERVHGATLGTLDLEPSNTCTVWRALGRDLAQLHSGVPADGPIVGQQGEILEDPRTLPEELAESGHFSTVEARWLRRWLDDLAPMVLAPMPERFLHGDVQATNVMVRSGSLEYLALIDWGASGWGDPAWDFAGFPLRAVPWVMEGYREVAPTDDETFEARILWRHLQLSLWLLGREPQPGRSWAERPVGMLLEVLRFFLENPGERWKAIAPPAGG